LGPNLRYRISDLQAWLDIQPENDRIIKVSSQRSRDLDLQEASDHFEPSNPLDPLPALV